MDHKNQLHSGDKPSEKSKPDQTNPDLAEMTQIKTVKSWNRFIPIILLVAGLCLILAFMKYYDIHLDQQFWADIAAQYDMITMWVHQHYMAMVLGFIIIYIIAVACSVPGAVFLTLTGGILFGWFAAILVVFSASIGALIVFLAARGAMASFFQLSSSRFLSQLKHGFDQSPFFWLLALRLMPVAPFWAVNIIPAFLGMRVLPYLMATIIGIIPGSVVFVYIGMGFGELMAIGKVPNLSLLSNQHFLGPMLSLSLLALVPALIQSRRKQSPDHPSNNKEEQ